MMNSKLNISHSPFAFPCYDRYKDSGIEWVKKIPYHWDVKPGRVTLSLNKEKNAGNIEDTVLSLSYGRLVIKPPEKMTGLVPESLEGYQIINPGDIIIRPTDLQNDWTSLRVGLAKDRGIITSAYLGLKHDDKISSEYLYYLLHSYDLLKVYYGMGTGLRQNLSWDDFKYLPLTLPPKPEQDRIVAFLDQKTGEIDVLIAKKQRQIELLDEQKAILINRAVTRGIVNEEFGMRNEHLSSSSHSTFTTHHSKFSPSGIEWIGEIPGHWEASHIKHLGNIVGGYAFPSTEFTENTADCRVVKIANIQTMRMDWADASYISNRYLKQLPQFRVGKGDLLFALTRPIIKAGIKAAIVEAEWPMLLNQRNAVFHPSRKINLEWLYYIIVNPEFVAHFDTLIDKTGQQPNISPVDIGNIVVPLPPKEERLRICQYLTDAQIRFSEVVQKIETHIESLKILRSTLIAHAVTGRIKV